MKRIKQSVGIDMSYKTFHAVYCKELEDGSLEYSEVNEFSNDKKGFNQLERTLNKLKDKNLPLIYLMEATGVYYESLAYHLHKIKKQVVVVLPNKSKHFLGSLNLKSKTDRIDAKALVQFAIERKHQLWEPPKQIYLELRSLTRYHTQLQDQKIMLINIKHSKESSHMVQKDIIKSNELIIKQIDKQITKIEKAIKDLVESNEALKSKVEKLLSIPGVGQTRVATIIAETLGFYRLNSIKQLICFCGLDVVQRESGTSIKRKTKISKKGNKYIRRVLYMPALVSIKHNEKLALFYQNIIARKPAKKIGVVAVQRKLLTLLFTLWKKDEFFNKDI